MKKGKYYWIRERHNPQFSKQYYVAHGQISVSEAKKYEKSLYGTDYMLKFDTKEEYEAKLSDLTGSGFTVFVH